ncbi:MAG: hypothetical protein NXH95_01275 [Pseudomonadaceae bacterium]|nr:hypothetical protein [Pseudomonadaceae bacterium]
MSVEIDAELIDDLVMRGVLSGDEAKDDYLRAMRLGEILEEILSQRDSVDQPACKIES